MLSQFSIWIILVDYVLGALMWTLIGRFGMSIFLSENSSFFFMRIFVSVTQPLINGFGPITPGFLVERLKPLYVAWFLYMARFYLFPLILGYNVMGMLSFPLESEFARVIYDIGKSLTGR